MACRASSACAQSPAWALGRLCGIRLGCRCVSRPAVCLGASCLIPEQLPSSVNPQMGPVTSIMGEIMLIALTSDGKASPMEVREIADFVVRPQLLAIPGVAQVIPIGGEVRQYRVTPNVATMQALGITHDQIEQAVAKFGTNSGGGFVNQHGREYLIRNVGLTKQIEDLGNTVVATRDEQPILLKQVALVDFAARAKRGDAGYNGKPAVIVSVQKQPAADTVGLTRNIEAALQDLQRTMRAGVKVTNVQFRQATFIETSIGNVERVLIEAAVVVALVLFIFLLNARATFVSLTAIPISILITVLVVRATRHRLYRFDTRLAVDVGHCDAGPVLLFVLRVGSITPTRKRCGPQPEGGKSAVARLGI